MSHPLATILEKFKSFDCLTLKIMRYGLYFSLFFCLFAATILLVYDIFYADPNLFYIGFSLIKSGIFFAVAFLIYGFAFDTIKREI